jgi:hypothetical protein
MDAGHEHRHVRKTGRQADRRGPMINVKMTNV